MIESMGWPRAETRYAGYDRIIGIFTWLLIALVSVDIALLPIDRGNALLLTLFCLALFCYKAVTGRFRPNDQLKISLDLALLLLFTVAVCWLTGKAASPFIAVIYLVLMATSLTLGRGITYLMAGVAMASYTLLASAQSALHRSDLAGLLIELFPFMLIAHLGTLFCREAEIARFQVERLSLTDDLTPLNNMRSFQALALQQEKLSKRYHRPFAICMLDSDNLKQVNYRYGHLAGTELIKWTARLILANTRDCDIAARFGGDEFIIMYNDHDKDRILPAVERIVRAVAANPFSFEGELIVATISAGIASFPLDGPDLRSVVKRADEAMYHSKSLGKNRASVFNEEAGGMRSATGRARTALPLHL